ncbi:GNAT family N-acetyltransferase [Clostridium perfringens]|nr:GNAT family N-acetyltransferase [Clostridium perfringens]MDU2435569.1 GNAT family N-acetyltransferase [Clostridium perfringens]MDU2515950.1 GNAT family N-acetyltransferase [Clostridium perfringens]TGY41974.1 N-acetyltransferase [Clostridium perfringens]
MRLETTRTILRSFEEKDLMDFHEYCSQEGIGEMAGWKHHSDLLNSEEALHNNIKNNNIFAIENKEDNKVIGHISINEDSEDGREDIKELGFVLNKNYHNRGIMTEVVYGILNYLFSNGIESVYACCFKNNKASKKLIEKCGFIFEAEGSFYSESLHKTFESFEYVYRKS